MKNRRDVLEYIFECWPEVRETAPLLSNKDLLMISKSHAFAFWRVQKKVNNLWLEVKKAFKI